MSKYRAYRTTQFKMDYKGAQKRNRDMVLLDEVILMLANGEKLPEAMRDHDLSGNYRGYRECHIEPDWLLVYRIQNDRLLLVLSRTGSHSDLFA